ncbi:unnamed protein product [Closterium sp. NIES-64]|nr:unnamed protein product [Closterium sp. NIES-64]
MSGPDALFSLRNNFQLGAYQAAINESGVGGLSEAESIERDTIVYRSYIALGSYQVRSAATRCARQLPGAPPPSRVTLVSGIPRGPCSDERAFPPTWPAAAGDGRDHGVVRHGAAGRQAARNLPRRQKQQGAPPTLRASHSSRFPRSSQVLSSFKLGWNLVSDLVRGAGRQDAVVAGLEGYLSDPVIGKNATLLLVAGTVYAREQNFVDALKIAHALPGNLELYVRDGAGWVDGAGRLEGVGRWEGVGWVGGRGVVGGWAGVGQWDGVVLLGWDGVVVLLLLVFLLMDRADLAEKQVKAMQQVDEDATLTQLALGWGGSKVQEATYVFQELADKFSPTVALLNGSALAQMHSGNFEDAEALLLDALNKDAKDANTLANLVVCSLHRGKPATRYLK